ncbi:MAG: hypothetical protein E6R04_01360 [Spirochaetes bacterium]|nr:MAG: hypothetical protein E6R04_01360 [Spirochaetota bacterium]
MNSPTTWDNRIYRIYSLGSVSSSTVFMALDKLLILEKFGSDSFALTEDELPVEGKAYALVFRALFCEKEEWLVVDEHTGVAGKNRHYRTCLRNSILPWQPERQESQA